MIYIFTGKNVTVTQGIKDYTEKRLNTIFSKSSLIEEDTEIKVLIRTYPIGQKIEITARPKGLVIRAEAKSRDLYSAIDDVAEKLKDQLRKYKTKNENKKKKESIPNAFISEYANKDEIIKTKSIIPQLMSVDEAITRMELLDHDFFIYTDDETKKIAVVYKRASSGYGLIETE